MTKKATHASSATPSLMRRILMAVLGIRRPTVRRPSTSGEAMRSVGSEEKTG